MDRNAALLTLLLFVIAAYLIGSISPAIILGRLRGIDIRKEGSGNAGTTNVLRVMGGKAALVTLTVDILKGFLSVLIPTLITGNLMYGCFCAVAVFFGHILPVYYGFKGGKGVATAFGAVLGVDWRLALACLGVTVLFTLLTQRMSVGSITGALSLVLLSRFLAPHFFGFSVVISAIILIRHRSNIKRLLKNQEPPMSIFDKKKKGKRNHQ